MRFCALMGSPHKEGNTAQLLRSFLEELQNCGMQGEVIRLYDREIKPCLGCRKCQRDWGVFGCPIHDDLQKIFDEVLSSELLVLGTPIYSWFCTPPMKSVLDRLVYGMNKYYGDEKGPSLWAGRKLVAVTTCGYPPEKGSDLFDEGLRRYSRHSGLNYLGMLTERDKGAGTSFMDEEKIARSKEFAGQIARAVQKESESHVFR